MTCTTTTVLPLLGTKCDSPAFVSHSSDSYFAFARIKGDLCLVQVSYATPPSALTTVDVKVFRHEFISIFRFAEYRTLHPTDITILEPINEQLTRYEEENETVFLARDVMERMRKLSAPRRSAFGMQAQKQRGLVTLRRW
jgi:hypothetical protein